MGDIDKKVVNYSVVLDVFRKIQTHKYIENNVTVTIPSNKQ